MAGRGPAPAETRRRSSAPARGDWVYLPPLTKPVLPALPKRAKGTGAWSARTRAAWKAWRSDRVTGEYSVADIQAAIDLAYLYEEWVRGADVAAEIRQRQDRLGLNPKGKRDLRWKAASADAEGSDSEKPAPGRRTQDGRRARLSIVK
jgi:hypothetical protein